MSNIDSTYNLYRTFNTVKEMLTDRGTDISNLNSISSNEFDILSRQNENNVFQIDVNDTMKIVYYLNIKFKIADLRKHLIPYDESSPLKTIIIIFKERINNFNHKNVEELSELDVQVFTMKELMFNITKHELVPKHEVIKDDQEISDLVQKHNLKSKLQFPIILKTDPMARYLNIQSGDIVKITRNSPSAGTSIFYRCCV